MFKRKIVSLVFIITILAALALFVMPAFAQAPTPPDLPPGTPTIPNVLQLMAFAVVGYLVTQGLKAISSMITGNPDALSGWGSLLTYGIATTIIYFSQALLTLVPPFWQNPVSILLALLAALLTGPGIHLTVKKFQPAQG
jgi:uncharacterized integral membrane protein